MGDPGPVFHSHETVAVGCMEASQDGCVGGHTIPLLSCKGSVRRKRSSAAPSSQLRPQNGDKASALAAPHESGLTLEMSGALVAVRCPLLGVAVPGECSGMTTEAWWSAKG